jgi:hypothetical protein
MRDVAQTARLLGYVQLQVGSKTFAVPVQAMKNAHGGGFFTEDSGMFGILVDDGAPDRDVQAQIARGSAEAMRHLSRRYLN